MPRQYGTGDMQPFTKTYTKGTNLFRENDRSRELYILQSGRILVYRTTGRVEIPLATIGPGAVLGEMAVIDGNPRSASAKALTDCSLIVIDVDTFAGKTKDVPAWFMSIIRGVSRKIREANKRLLSAHGTHGADVALALRYFFHQKSRWDSDSIQKHLVALLSTTTQHVSTVIDFLREKNLVAIHDGMITSTDLERYDRYCTFLRIQLKKGFEKLPELSTDAATAVSNGMQILLEDEQRSRNRKLRIDANQLSRFLDIPDASRDSKGISLELETHGLLEIPRRQVEGGDENYINIAKWRNQALYYEFKDSIPGV